MSYANEWATVLLQDDRKAEICKRIGDILLAVRGTTMGTTDLMDKLWPVGSCSGPDFEIRKRVVALVLQVAPKCPYAIRGNASRRKYMGHAIRPWVWFMPAPLLPAVSNEAPAPHKTCAQILVAIEGARLPDGYLWGADAQEHFEFGKTRAAEAVRELFKQ